MTRTLASTPSPDTRMAAVALLGVGLAEPPGLSQSDAALHCQTLCCDTDAQAQFLRRIFANSGIRRRGSVLIDQEDRLDRIAAFFRPRSGPDDAGPSTAQRMALYAGLAPPLATKAARGALDDAQAASNEVTHLITVSCTGFVAPGLDYQLIQNLALSPNVQRLHIGFMGCHGAFNGLAAALHIARANPAARILLCCAELCTLHLAYGFDPQRLVANSLFADGAAAALISQPARSDRRRWLIDSCASQLLTDSADAMTWSIGDHGFTMTLSPRVPDIVRQQLEPWLCRWLQSRGMEICDIPHWAVHPGGPRVLTAVAEATGLDSSVLAPSRAVLADHGNMSSATILFVLNQLDRSPVTGPCLALGFGPGLMAEGMLLRPACHL